MKNISKEKVLDLLVPNHTVETMSAVVEELGAIRTDVGRAQALAAESAAKDNFPMRNRTMALVSQATVIVDAQERSGTVSQGWEAIRLGRPLYLLRSLAENPSLEWPGLMLQYGAEVLDDIAALVLRSAAPSRA